MTKFRFRLESVLTVKAAREADCLQAFAAAVRRLESARAQEAELQHLIATYEHKLMELRHGIIALDQERVYSTYVARLRDQWHEATEAVAQAEIIHQDSLNSLTAATQEREALEKLKERQYREYLEEVARVEQKEMDEIAQRWTEHGEVASRHHHSHHIDHRIDDHAPIDGGD